MYARANGMAEFIIYQGLWNVNKRDFEREIIPMCESAARLRTSPCRALDRQADTSLTFVDPRFRYRSLH